MAMAVFLLSPVNKTTFTPIWRIVCTAKLASGLTVSATAIIPVKNPVEMKVISGFMIYTSVNIHPRHCIDIFYMMSRCLVLNLYLNLNNKVKKDL